jgi:HK97 family phage major capsid protein
MSFRELRMVIEEINTLADEARPILDKLHRGERLSTMESRKIAEGADKAIDLRSREVDLRAAVALSEDAMARAGDIGVSSSADNSPESRAFTNYLRTGAITPEMRAAGEASGSAGGYLVPPGWWQRLQVALKAYGGTSADFQQIETDTGQSMVWATNDPTSTVATLLAENTQVSNVDYTFGQGTLGAYMYDSGVQLVSFQLAQDSAFDIDAYVQARVAEQLGRAQAAAAISGSGSSQPLGIITALNASSGLTSGGKYALGTATKVNVAGATSTTGASQVTELISGTLSPASWLGVLKSVDKAYRSLGAKWYMNDSTLQATRLITNGFGDPYYSELQDDTQPKLYGYDVVVDNNIPSLTASTASGVIFGHLESAMVLRSVKGAGLLTLTERYADFLQNGYIGYRRFDIRSNDLRAAVVVVPSAT